METSRDKKIILPMMFRLVISCEARIYHLCEPEQLQECRCNGLGSLGQAGNTHTVPGTRLRR
jgi:hypothetical protein